MTSADIDDLRGRLERARHAAAEAGISALLVSPGPDLRYLTGYEAVALERLTCLVLPADGDPVLVVPGLEQAAATASPVGALGLEVSPWRETDDPFAKVAAIVDASNTRAGTAHRVGVDDRMWASKVLRLRSAMPAAEQVTAGSVLSPLRMRKSPAEVDALRGAGEAIDRVHASMGDWLRVGRTEREVARDIATAIVDAGHVRVDFVIVASGPNGASPHHEASDRVIGPDEPVVVDIGGTMPSGYCSDSTRTYLAAGTPPQDFATSYEVLRQAQDAACRHARPGVSAESVDAAAREPIAAAGYGKAFVHRTGHGIGLETHEDPYIVEGNLLVLEPGMAFSIEPGIYTPGAHGARIEDIVVVTQDGAERLNRRPREFVILAS